MLTVTMADGRSILAEIIGTFLLKFVIIDHIQHIFRNIIKLYH